MVARRRRRRCSRRLRRARRGRAGVRVTGAPDRRRSSTVTAAIVGSGQHRHRPDGQAAALRRWCSRAGWSAIDPRQRRLGAGPRGRPERRAPTGSTGCCGRRRACPTSCSRRPPRGSTRPTRPRYAEAGILAIDLTPAAVGPYVVPSSTSTPISTRPNVNMVTCGGQATVPIVARRRPRRRRCRYAEIVASIASRSAGPGTRANIDEFTRDDGARDRRRSAAPARGKAIIILNPGRAAADDA